MQFVRQFDCSCALCCKLDESLLDFRYLEPLSRAAGGGSAGALRGRRADAVQRRSTRRRCKATLCHESERRAKRAEGLGAATAAAGLLARCAAAAGALRGRDAPPRPPPPTAARPAAMAWLEGRVSSASARVCLRMMCLHCVRMAAATVVAYWGQGVWAAHARYASLPADFAVLPRAAAPSPHTPPNPLPPPRRPRRRARPPAVRPPLLRSLRRARRPPAAAGEGSPLARSASAVARRVASC